MHQFLTNKWFLFESALIVYFNLLMLIIKFCNKITGFIILTPGILTIKKNHHNFSSNNLFLFYNKSWSFSSQRMYAILNFKPNSFSFVFFNLLFD